MKITDIKNLVKYLVLSSLLLLGCYSLLTVSIVYACILKSFPRYYIYIIVMFSIFTLYITYLLSNELLIKWKKIIKDGVEVKEGQITHIQPGSTAISGIPLIKIDNVVVPLKGFYGKKDYLEDGRFIVVGYSKKHNCAIVLKEKGKN